jgi:hypothetical protein
MRFKFSYLGLLITLSHLQASDPVREMSTDRPDTTESPYSVPAGMFQIEASFFDYSRDSNSGFSSSDQWIYGQINFKMGVGKDSDLQVIVNSHAVAGESERGDSTRTNGFGDVTVRFKQNLWGNDSGTTALALMPYVTIPTHTQVSDEAWAGGLIVPLAISLTDRISLGLMIEADLVPDADTNGYDLEWVHSATLGLSLTDQLSLYLELVGIAGQDADYQALFDTGLTFAVTESLVIDAGIRLGMNRPAPDFGVFTGMSIRF